MENIHKNKMTAYHHYAWFGSDNHNASRNLLAKGLEYLSRGGHSRINAQGHLNLCSISESLLDKFGD